MRIARKITDLIGNTPLLELNNIIKEQNIKATILAKLEYYNPAGSVKDRVALAIIEDAEERGELSEGGTIIEATSGNTGIGICHVAAAKGYKVIIVMPDTMSSERRNIIKAYGGELILTDGILGMKGAIAKAEDIHKTISNSIIAGQFVNMSNPKKHYNTTAPEIWNDTDGKVDIFVSGIGTGGTISGVGKYLKERNPNIKIVAVEPLSAPLLSTGVGGTHKIAGIGAGFIPNTLDTNIYDEIITISNEDAYSTGRMIARSEGVLVGVSSGAALCAAIKVADRPENYNKMIVVLLPDTGERYLSTEMFV